MRVPFSFLGGAAPEAPVTGIQFPGADSYVGAGASGAISAARVRWRLDAMPGTSDAILAGTDPDAGAAGWLMLFVDSISGSDVGQLNFYVKISGGSWTLITRKFFMPDDVGRIFTAHIVCDGAKAYAYLDGKKLSAGITCAAITSSSSPMNIGGTSGLLYTSEVTVLDVAEGTTVLDPEDVAADALSPVPAFAGQTHRYTASESVGATWVDEVGSEDLTRHGSPVPTTFSPTYGRHRGTLEIYGDSIAAGRREDNGLGDGWRRGVERYASAHGKAITLIGYVPMTASTKDFDYNATATPGQDLQDRLTTLAADLAANGPPDAATLLAYGINDLAAINRTAVELAGDIATACALIEAARPGRPIFVCNILPVGAGAATAPQHAEIDAFIAGFAAMIASIQVTIPNVVPIDVSTCIVDPDDVAWLFDEIHPSVGLGYPAYAAVAAPVIVAAMS